jgi:predicted  nucleic acid-binding Zn ribbon protein
MEVTMFGRLQLYIFIGIFLFGALTAGYYNWRKGIEREALLEYNQHQLEQNIKDQEAMKQQLESINNKQKEIEAANAESKKLFKDKIDSISTDLNSKETVAADKSSSDVLKKTVTKLKDVVK